MNATIRVLLVDDCLTLCAGLRRYFEQASDVVIVGEVGDGTQVLAQVEALHPDVVVLDCQLPGMSGVEIAAAIKSKGLPTRILAFSVHDDEAYVRGMIDAGAAGYLLKDEAPERIVEAVHAAARGECCFSEKIVAKLAVWAHREMTATSNVKLTEREREVLGFVAKGWRNKQIADELNMCEVTVRFHLRNIFGKAGVKTRTEAAAWAIHNGLADEK